MSAGAEPPGTDEQLDSSRLGILSFVGSRPERSE